MQTIPLKDCAAIKDKTEDLNLAEAAYIGWLELPEDTDKIYPVLDLKLNASGLYDLATLLTQGVSVKRLLNSPWGRTEKGRQALSHYAGGIRSSPLYGMVEQCKLASKTTTTFDYYIEQLIIQCKKFKSKEQTEHALERLEEVKAILTAAPAKIDVNNF